MYTYFFYCYNDLKPNFLRFDWLRELPNRKWDMKHWTDSDLKRTRKFPLNSEENYFCSDGTEKNKGISIIKQNYRKRTEKCFLFTYAWNLDRQPYLGNMSRKDFDSSYCNIFYFNPTASEGGFFLRVGMYICMNFNIFGTPYSPNGFTVFDIWGVVDSSDL